MSRVSLIGRGGVYANSEIPITADTIIGRDPRICQVVFPASERSVSGRHCRVQNMNGCMVVTDLGSTNGTFLHSGERLMPNAPRTLGNGDGFYLGDRNNMFTVRVEADAMPMPAVAPAPSAGYAAAPMPNANPQNNGNAGNSGNNGRKIWPIVASVAAAAVIIILIFAGVSASNEAARARQELYEEQNKGLIEKTIDAADDWLKLFK